MPFLPALEKKATQEFHMFEESKFPTDMVVRNKRLSPRTQRAMQDEADNYASMVPEDKRAEVNAMYMNQFDLEFLERYDEDETMHKIINEATKGHEQKLK